MINRHLSKLHASSLVSNHTASQQAPVPVSKTAHAKILGIVDVHIRISHIHVVFVSSQSNHAQGAYTHAVQRGIDASCTHVCRPAAQQLTQDRH